MVFVVHFPWLILKVHICLFAKGHKKTIISYFIPLESEPNESFLKLEQFQGRVLYKHEKVFLNLSL